MESANKTDWKEWKTTLKVPFLPGLRYAELLDYAGPYAEQVAENQKKAIEKHKDDAPKDKKKPVAKKPLIIPKELATRIAHYWDFFARSYSHNGKDSGHLDALNSLHNLAFGEGVDAFLKKQGLVEVTESDPDQRQILQKQLDQRIQKLLEPLAPVCMANSYDLTTKENSKHRPMNRALIDALVKQWIAHERRFGLFPPVEISTEKGVSHAEKAGVLARREAVLHTAAGQIFCNALWFLNIQLVKAETLSVLKKICKPTTDENVEEALSISRAIFENVLFKYDPRHGAELNTFIVSTLRQYLPKQIIRDERRHQRNLSLHTGREEATLLHRLVDQRSEDPAEIAERNELTQQALEAMEQLDPRDKRILLMRAEGQSFTEIGAQLGVTYQRVQQLEERAVSKVLGSNAPGSFVARVQARDGEEERYRQQLRDLFTDATGQHLSVSNIAKLTGVKTSDVSVLMGPHSNGKLVATAALSDGKKEKYAAYLQEAGGDIERFHELFAKLREITHYRGKGNKRT